VPPDFSVIEGAYLRDILDQPRALDETLAGLEVSKALDQLATRLQQGKFKTVVLTGMGSSFHALHPLNIELVNHGFTAMMVETSELLALQKPPLRSEDADRRGFSIRAERRGCPAAGDQSSASPPSLR
jgi:fructoselysine-6-P-deglycase FrlB-like protein